MSCSTQRTNDFNGVVANEAAMTTSTAKEGRSASETPERRDADSAKERRDERADDATE